MKTHTLCALMLAAFAAPNAISQNIATTAAPEGSAKTIYRQVLPDGRVVYSDKAIKGVKVERTISANYGRSSAPDSNRAIASREVSRTSGGTADSSASGK